MDARHLLRTLRRTPGFAIITILTLALGIGVTTTITSIVDHALLNALCVLLPVAWSVLQLRWWERTTPDAAAAHVLTPTQLDVLVRHQHGRSPQLSEPPTVREALWAIAGLGGHLRHNGAPGMLTILRGFHTLTWMEQAVLALRTPLPPTM